MTTLRPGHNPPVVTIQARTSSGLKKRCFLGPALKYFFASVIGFFGPKIAVALKIKLIYHFSLT